MKNIEEILKVQMELQTIQEKLSQDELTDKMRDMLINDRIDLLEKLREIREA